MPLGGGDDHSGVIERIALGQAIESFGDAEPLSARDADAGVEAAFDVEGETEPGVAGCGRLRDRAEARAEVFGGGRAVRDGSEPGDSFTAERFGDGGEVALGRVAVAAGENGAGAAETVEAVGEGVVLVHGGEDGVGPVVGELAVDAGDLVVAPLVRRRPPPVLLLRDAGTAGERTIGTQLLLDGVEPFDGGVAGREKSGVGSAGFGSKLAETAGLGELSFDASEFAPGPSRFLLAALRGGRVSSVGQRRIRRGGSEGGFVLGPLGPEASIEHPRVVGSGEGPIRDTGRGGENLLVGRARINDDVAVLLTAQLAEGVPGVGGPSAAALADVGGEAVEVGGGEQVDLLPGAALGTVDRAGPGVGEVRGAVGSAAGDVLNGAIRTFKPCEVRGAPPTPLDPAVRKPRPP